MIKLTVSSSARNRKQKKITSNQTDNTTSDDDSDNMEHFSRVTRSGSSVQKIRSLLRDIENKSIEQILQHDTMECIVGCGRKKSMLLLPCQHQHTCRECWLMWKIESVKQIPNQVFDESFDESIMQPKCLVCRTPVDKEISVFN